jgi:putative ATPase
MSNGDGRIALNALELALETSELTIDNYLLINMNIIQNCIQKRPILFDKSSESHYDNISAFIKSMRGSDPDAAVFYLARAIYAGESPEFLARRIIVCASEDVGMANPTALSVAVAAAQAIQMIGMPEARLILSHAAIMVATSPKSNSCYKAVLQALDDIEKKDTGQVPMHLRNAPFSEMEELGYGKGYKYSHDYKNNIVKQDYLPDSIKGTIYYDPSNNGYEERINKWLKNWRESKGE